MGCLTRCSKPTECIIIPLFSLTCDLQRARQEEKEGDDGVAYIGVLSALLISLTVPLLGM